MVNTRVAARQTVIDLRTAVQRLPAAELREFSRWLTEWQEQNGSEGDEDAVLIARTKVHLPAAEKRRLKRLSAKSQQGVLTAKELPIYRDLAQRAEQLDGMRLAALAELARRWDKPLGDVMAAVGWKGAEDGT